MKSFFAFQIGAVFVVAIALGSVLYTTGVYSDVQNNIVNVLCLSCIKLDPKTSANFTFDTGTGEPHPAFIRDNLTTGPIVIAYSEDVCEACEQMHPVIEHLLNVSYGEKDAVYTHTLYEGTNVTFFFINIDHNTPQFAATRAIYDKDDVDGLPMFTFITLRYDEGPVRPYYTSVYGVVSETALAGILTDSIHLYHENSVGYQP